MMGLSLLFRFLIALNAAQVSQCPPNGAVMRFLGVLLILHVLPEKSANLKARVKMAA